MKKGGLSSDRVITDWSGHGMAGSCGVQWPGQEEELGRLMWPVG